MSNNSSSSRGTSTEPSEASETKPRVVPWAVACLLSAVLAVGVSSLFDFTRSEEAEQRAEEDYARSVHSGGGSGSDSLLDPGLLIAMGATVFMLALALVFFTLHLRKDGRSIEQGREQVREAEQGLEGALSVIGEAVGVPRSRAAAEDEPVPKDDVKHEGEAASDGRDLALAPLWKLTHRRLDLYHKIATNQAKWSFASAQIAIVIGFILLVLFVGVALRASTTAGAVVAGGLGTVSAALAGFVSKTFVKSQETAAEHLKAYFDQPLEFSRYLAAERLLADSGLSEDRRAEVVGQLVQVIASGPGGGTPPDAGGVAQLLRQLINGQQ
ncbi:hypothetical protein ACIBU0_43815 [Streptomyces sp. NPDC049627]|uniref:TRADD-N-associated membrane domain-containing protein n=1 Tax=Streptomyces sp. NPDC049627 TaxID=3365595 RepID=UPI0037BC2BAF